MNVSTATGNGRAWWKLPKKCRFVPEKLKPSPACTFICSRPEVRSPCPSRTTRLRDVGVLSPTVVQVASTRSPTLIKAAFVGTMSPDTYPRALGLGSRTSDMSHRQLSLTMKAIASRAVRESSKLASATVAARLRGQNGERSKRVNRAHGEERLKVAQLRTTRREAIYGDAVKQANMRGGNGREVKSNKYKSSSAAR